MQIRTFVITSDNYIWSLKPFSYLHNLFWSELQPVIVVGYTPPSFELPHNFAFYSVDSYNYPPNKWSDALIKFLNSVDDEIFCLLFDDYWLTRTADCGGIASLADYMQIHQQVLRLDLTTDRLHAKGDARDAMDLEAWGHYDIIYTTHDIPYQMSFQPALWNRKHLLSILEYGRSPWEIELYTSPAQEMMVCGTRQWPLRIANGILKGKVLWSEVNKIPQPHRDKIKQWIPDNWSVQVP